MSKSLKIIHHTDKQSRDEVIGQSISRTLNTLELDGTCLSLEEIAALVDGSLPVEQRDRLFSHMASCARCRETYIMSMELSKPEPSAENRINWYWAISALAVAAAVVFVLILTLHQGRQNSEQVAVNTTQLPSARPEKVIPGPLPNQSTIISRPGKIPVSIPPSADQTARHLAEIQNPSILLNNATDNKTKSYGFATAPSAAKAAFHIGRDSLILEIALLGHDSDSAGMALTRIGQYLPAAGSNLQLINRVKDNKELAFLGESLASLKGLTVRIENELPPHVRNFIRFGIWCEAARLSISMGKKELINPETINYFEENLPVSQLTPEELHALKELAASLNKQQTSFKEISSKLENVTKLFF